MIPTHPSTHYRFIAPEIICGPGTRHLAGSYARQLGVRRVLLVTDAGIQSSGWSQDVITSLKTSGVTVTVFDWVTPCPKDQEIMAGAKLFAEARCGATVAVGGGSTIDCAKCIGLAHTNRRQILTMAGINQFEVPPPPMICIPTTAGTGAEASPMAMITDMSRGTQVAVVGRALVPDLALFDPETTVSLTRAATVNGGLDSLAHAFESLASTGSSPLTVPHALAAIRLITRHLANVLEAPGDIEERQALMTAGMHGGIAAANAGLGLAHAMSHGLAGRMNQSHGAFAGILLPHVLDFNFDLAANGYAQAVEALGLDGRLTPPQEQRGAIIGALRRFLGLIGAPTRLSDLGVSTDDLFGLATIALQDLCRTTNPRASSHDNIQALYEHAL